MALIKCNNCGNEIDENQIKCIYCGSSISNMNINISEENIQIGENIKDINYIKKENYGQEIDENYNAIQNDNNMSNSNISNYNNQTNTKTKRKISNVLKNGMFIGIGFILGLIPLLIKELKPLDNTTQEKSIIGIWVEDNNPDALVFTENKMIKIRTGVNNISSYDYKIEENHLILDETKYIEYDINGDILYLNGSILKKQNENYKLPSIYYNHDAFFGTWKLESDTKLIKLENGDEITLNDELIITEDNVSGYGSCVGVCNPYIINFNNTNPEIYLGNLCYELANKNTLQLIKCHSGLIGEREDEILHNITYKKNN